MTNKQLRDRVVAEIGLQDIEDFNETTMVDDLIYEGIIDILARTRCTVRCVHLKTKADEGEYVLDRSILALVDVEDGRVPRLRRDESGLGFTLVRSDVLLFDPPPSEDGEVDVWAVIRPTKMTDDSHTPSTDAYGGLPDEYHDAIFLYACWKASSYADDESGAMGERYRSAYEGQDGSGGKLRLIRQLVNKRGTARAPRVAFACGRRSPPSLGGLMGKPSALLQEANSFARDFPRDRMPEGYMWDMVDFVPVLLDAQLTGQRRVEVGVGAPHS